MTTMTDTAFAPLTYGAAPEARDAADTWLSTHGSQFDLFIGGQWQAPLSKQYFASTNPAQGELLAQIAQANAADIDRAVAAAKTALPAWQKHSGFERAKYLYAIARQIQKHARLFAVLESLDNGKPIRETRDIDIPLVAQHFYHHAGWAQSLDTHYPGHNALGVVGQIIPWNFPLLMLAWKIAPALACGNTVVLKPAEFTSLTALLFAEICQQVGLPNGVVNIVTGAAETGSAIVNHPDIAKIAFTGSTAVGQLIREQCAGTGKKLSLELGGKSPFIVFADADIDGAVEGLIDAIWFNQGQVCCAGSRLLVQEGIAETLIARIQQRLSHLIIGDPLDKNTEMGALVDASQWTRVNELVQAGCEDFTCWQPKLNLPTKGHYFLPTLFTEVTPEAMLWQTEIFGPVLVSATFRTPEEAIALANNTAYGLAASVWTEDMNLALECAPQLAAGVVWLNCTNQFHASAPFGGKRLSGFGREGGLEGLSEYLRAPALPSSKTEIKAMPAKATANTIDRTLKHYIGGKQVRPDGGYSETLLNDKAQFAGNLPSGNRKDIRNAVEAAENAGGWTRLSPFQRAQILYYIAENLQTRRDEFIQHHTAFMSSKQATLEVDQSIAQLFYYAGQCDKFDGRTRVINATTMALALPEPHEIIGIIGPDNAGLLGLINTVMPAIALGNRVINLVTSPAALALAEIHQVFDTSDLPAGVINLVYGAHNDCLENLASHDSLNALWYFGSAAPVQRLEQLATQTMTRTWINTQAIDWSALTEAQCQQFLHHATDLKTVWLPYGVSI